MAERRVVLVVVRDDDGALDQGAPEHPGPGRQLQAADPLAAALAADPGVMREPQVPGRGVDEVDHRAVGIEQPGGLLDGDRQQLVDPARTPPSGSGLGGVGSSLARVGRRSGWGGHRREDTTGPPRAGIAVRPMAATSSGRCAASTASPAARRASVEVGSVSLVRRAAGAPRRRCRHDTARLTGHHHVARSRPRCSLPERRSAPPTSSSAPPSSASRWRPATSTRRWAACCSR